MGDITVSLKPRSLNPGPYQIDVVLREYFSDTVRSVILMQIEI
jgi:hypothetical protein